MTRFHLVQTPLMWEDPSANRALLETAIDNIDGGIIVFPEMFSTGFSMASERLAEPMDGPTIQWLTALADRHNAQVCGSLIVTQAGQYFNRFVWCNPGSTSPLTYDKRHLFRMADEHEYYAAGEQNIVIESKGLKILPQVCYDLRFPVWSRNRVSASSDGELTYNVLLYVANWPAKRHDQWLALLKARAIENQAYVVAVNRVGTDGNGIAYAGGSCVIDPVGEYLISPDDNAAILSTELDLPALASYRRSFPAFMDGDTFQLEP